MNRRAITAVLLITVGVTVVVFPALEAPADNSYQTSPAQTAKQRGELMTAAVIEQANDEQWWVLEISLEDGNATVYEYTESWRPTGTSHVITAPAAGHKKSILPADISQQPNGEWYVLDRNNTIYVFDSQWQYTGRTIRLPRRSEWITSRRSSAFEKTPQGWWVDAYGRLTLYDASFERIVVSYDGYQDLDLGAEYYNSYYGAMTVGDITSLDVDNSGTIWLRASLGKKIYKFKGVTDEGLDSTSPDAVFTPGKNPPYASDTDAVTGGERYVLRGNGNLYTYSRDWIYTGTVRRVGSGEAYDRYPPDVVSLAVLIVPLFNAVTKLVPLFFIVVVLWIGNRRISDDEDLYTPAVISATVTYAFFINPYPLRPLLFVHPLVLIGALLGVVAAIVCHQVLERNTAPGHLVIYSPILLKTAEIGLNLSGIYISTPF